MASVVVFGHPHGGEAANAIEEDPSGDPCRLRRWPVDAGLPAGDLRRREPRRRTRRRRRTGSAATEDAPGVVTRVRQPRPERDEVTGVKGSTRLEAKRQRRREGREADDHERREREEPALPEGSGDRPGLNRARDVDLQTEQQQQERAAEEAQRAGLQAGLQKGREQLAAAKQAATGEGGFPQPGRGAAQHSEDSGSAAPYGPSASARLQGAGSEITLPRAVVSGDTSSTGPGAETAARVPYDEVYPTYAEAAATALSRQPLPPGLRASIHSYFSALAPADAATP